MKNLLRCALGAAFVTALAGCPSSNTGDAGNNDVVVIITFDGGDAARDATSDATTDATNDAGSDAAIDAGGDGATPDVPVSDVPVSDVPTDTASCTGDGGCYACPPSALSDYLNQCTASRCAPFDNHARLPGLLSDGGLPPLP